MDRETVTEHEAPEGEAPPAIPAEIQAYLDLDFSVTGALAKVLLDQADGEAIQDEIPLSEVVGQAPANLTSAMQAWYQGYVSPPRRDAIQAIIGYFQEHAETGKADGFALQLRIGTLDENLLQDKLNFYRDHNERFHTQSEDIKRKQNDLMQKRHDYETKKAELGRDARILNWWLYLGVLIVVIFGSEAAINLELFEALPWATPAIAWGATILIGIAIGLAAHYHGTVYKQYAYYFDASQDDTKRGPALRMIAGGSTALLVALSFVYYARSAYLTAYLGSVGSLGQDSESTNFLWVVGGSLLGNILVYLTGTLWAYLLHDSDPDFPELKLEVRKLEARIATLKGQLESARVRTLEQLSAAHKRAVDAARRMNAVLSTQPRYRKAQELFSKVMRQDDAIIAILLSYRTKLVQRAASLGKRTRFIADTEDPFARKKILTAAEFQRVAFKLKYLES